MDNHQKSSIAKLYAVLKVIIELAPVFGGLYVVLQYPGYVTYRIVILAFAIGIAAVFVSTSWRRLRGWRTPIGIVGAAVLFAAFLGLSYRIYRSQWGPFRILVIDFEGSSDIKTRLRDEVWNSLSTTLKGKPGINLLNPSGPLSGPQELVAFEEARRR